LARERQNEKRANSLTLVEEGEPEQETKARVCYRLRPANKAGGWAPAKGGKSNQGRKRLLSLTKKSGTHKNF